MCICVEGPPEFTMQDLLLLTKYAGDQVMHEVHLILSLHANLRS